MNSNYKPNHIDSQGCVQMVNVSGKQPTHREASARALIVFPEQIFRDLDRRGFMVKKGSVIQTAILAGIQAAKKTSELIPLCHILPLDGVTIEIEPFGNNSLSVICKVCVFAKTGVEMEALTGATVASLTIYDMCKAMGLGIKIQNIELIEKKGGKTDYEN